MKRFVELMSILRSMTFRVFFETVPMADWTKNNLHKCMRNCIRMAKLMPIASKGLEFNEEMYENFERLASLR